MAFSIVYRRKAIVVVKKIYSLAISVFSRFSLSTLMQ